jgi:RNA polymerase sigma-70 factor, ECF subfamily
MARKGGGTGHLGDSSRGGQAATAMAREFLLRSQTRAFRFFRRHGFAESEAEELTQEVFLRVSQNMDRLRSATAAEAWLRTIMATVWKNELRRRGAIKRNAREVSFEAEREAGNEEVERHQTIGTPRSADPIEQALSGEYLAAVRSCLNELPPSMRRCLVLFAFQERRYQEIADLLHISIERVKSQIYQARQHLQACIARWGSGSSPGVA